MSDCYNLSDSAQTQRQPGADDRVLLNKLGITAPELTLRALRVLGG